MRLTRRLACSGLLFAAAVAIMPDGRAGSVAAQSQSREVFTGGGLEAGSPRDVRAFLRGIDLAFVGRIMDISPEFVGDDRDHVMTKVAFTLTETIKASRRLSAAEPLEIWASGGSYVETVNGRRPRSPSELASHLKIGSVYFVPAVYIRHPNTPFDGLPAFAGSDAVVEIDGRSIRPASPSDWSDAIVANGRTISLTPGVLLDEATAFLTAIRRAAVTQDKTPQ